MIVLAPDAAQLSTPNPILHGPAGLGLEHFITTQEIDPLYGNIGGRTFNALAKNVGYLHRIQPILMLDEDTAGLDVVRAFNFANPNFNKKTHARETIMPRLMLEALSTMYFPGIGKNMLRFTKYLLSVTAERSPVAEQAR